jgi:hypothetical protein
MGTSYSPNIVKDGLVFYVDPINPRSWTGPNSNTVNDLKSTSTGTIYNDTSGSYGDNSSFTFDGADSYIDLGNLTLLNGATNASWGFWANVDTTPNQMPISQWSDSSKIFYVYFNGANTLKVAMNGNQAFSTSFSFSTGVWNYFIITLDGGASSPSNRVRGYVNGTELSNSTSGPTVLATATSNFNIGRREASGGGFYFDGDISSFKIYNRTLSIQEVKQNYNALKRRFI